MYIYCWYFFIFAFLGWCAEVTYAAVRQRRFVNRGFLNGPVCPIYGFGIVIVAFLLQPMRETFVLLFVCSVVLTSALEWLTGFLLEKIFHSKWWDYSDKPLNIGGYICLQFSLLWGAACLIIVKWILPLTQRLVDWIPFGLSVALLIFFTVLLLSDCVATVFTVRGINRQLRGLSLLAEKLKSDSDKIGRAVSKNGIWLAEKQADMRLQYEKLLQKHNAFTRRILKAFPNLHSMKYNEQLRLLQNKIREYRRKKR